MAYLPELASLTPDVHTREFWDWCTRRELRFQRCDACGRFRQPPRPGCPHCGAAAATWARVAGRARLFTHTVVHHAAFPALTARVPYNVAIVGFDGAPGVRLITNVLDAAPADPRSAWPSSWDRRRRASSCRGSGAHDAALAGLRVVDLVGTRGLTTLVLADYGADVLRIEPPAGDVLRGEPAWPLWGRGKRSVVLDLHEASARATVRRLVEGADVVVASFRPGRAERWRLAYEDFADQHPGLVYASITGFGRKGPYAALKGYEGVVMAKVGGMGHVAGMAARPGPAFPAVPYASFSAAHTALHGILAALLVRERTGRGQHVETCLAHAIAAHDPWEWFLRVVCEKYPQAYTPAPPYSARGVPTQGFAFRLLVCLTKDGRWLQFSQTAPHLFREFMDVLGLGWMFDDPRWKSAPDFEAEADREAFWEILLEKARERTVEEWDAVFREHPNVWAELFRTTREALDHPQLRHNRQVIVVDDPHAGPTEQLAPLVHMEATPAVVRPAAALGADTQAVLDALTSGALKAPAQRLTGTMPDRPLAGFTILDLGLWYAAPFGPALLAVSARA